MKSTLLKRLNDALFHPVFLKKTDEYLLKHHPDFWATKLHGLVYYLFISTLICGAFILAFPAFPDKILNLVIFIILAVILLLSISSNYLNGFSILKRFNIKRQFRIWIYFTLVAFVSSILISTVYFWSGVKVKKLFSEEEITKLERIWWLGKYRWQEHDGASSKRLAEIINNPEQDNYYQSEEFKEILNAYIAPHRNTNNMDSVTFGDYKRLTDSLYVSFLPEAFLIVSGQNKKVDNLYKKYQFCLFYAISDAEKLQDKRAEKILRQRTLRQNAADSLYSGLFDDYTGDFFTSSAWKVKSSKIEWAVNKWNYSYLKNNFIFFFLIILQIPFLWLINFDKNQKNWHFRNEMSTILAISFVICFILYAIEASAPSDESPNPVLGAHPKIKNSLFYSPLVHYYYIFLIFLNIISASTFRIKILDAGYYRMPALLLWAHVCVVFIGIFYSLLEDITSLLMLYIPLTLISYFLYTFQIKRLDALPRRS